MPLMSIQVTSAQVLLLGCALLLTVNKFVTAQDATDDYVPATLENQATVQPDYQPTTALTHVMPIFEVTMLLAALLLVFRALSHVCEGFLVPAVEVLINEFDVPEEMAGVTLLALGSAAPEITMNSVSSLTQDSSSISLTSILGSAMIAFGLIPGLCILMTKNCTHMKLCVWPIFREVSFFSVTLVYFFFSIEDGVVTMVESVHLIMVYLVYVLLVIGMFYLRKSTSKQDSDNVRLQQDSDTEVMVDVEAVQKECMPAQYACISRPFSILDSMLEKALYCTIPMVAPSHLVKISGKSGACCDVTLFRALLSLFVSVLHVTLFSAVLVRMGTSIVELLGIEGGTLGATLIALGAQIPDIMNSIALSRSGFFDAAMANAIGSQVINVSIGIGLPMTISCLLFGGEVLIAKGSAQSLSLLAMLLLVIIIVYIVMTLPLANFLRCKFSQTTTLNRGGSTILIICFFVSHAIYITKNEVL